MVKKPSFTFWFDLSYLRVSVAKWFFSQLLPRDGTDLTATESRDAHRRATRCRGKGAELIFQLGQHCLV